MSKTANVFARIEPEIKEQAEDVLGQLGIPMSNAIGLFLRQVVLQRGMPFEMKLPRKKPLALGALSDAELAAELQKGLDDLHAGRVHPAEEVFAELKAEFGI